MIAFFSVATCLLLPESASTGGRSFSKHRSDLLAGRVALERGAGKTDWWVTGYVTNRGNYPWRVRELEIRFEDPAGNLLDVGHPKVTDPFVVAPGSNGAFHAKLLLVMFTNSDVVHRVRVQTATDGDLPLDPN
jgi:hypothetical protein